ncbi:MAG TPA: DinB family protein [Candidatus Krumholzibacteria bacterium]|nr:DinB family protein [Candidatus Krumholzibacteria bacterium]
MEMKQYLLDTFAFNDRANKQILARITALPDRTQSIRFFSHLINSQKKWLARINQFPKDPGLDWWEPAYALEDLEREWDASLAAWRDFLASKSEEELFAEVKWVGFDGKQWTAPLKDIALQLNYHSIHHRAQIQTLIRAQGQTPDFIDYIGTIYRRVE